MAGPAWISKVSAWPAGVLRAGRAGTVRERGPRRARTVGQPCARTAAPEAGPAKVTPGPGCPHERRAGAGPGPGRGRRGRSAAGGAGV